MEIHHLIYALEVKNCGSISKAAQKLFMAQPNLSNAIKELEQEINIVIFKRTNRGIEPTREGLEFLHYAEGVVMQFQALDNIYIKQSRKTIKTAITVMKSSTLCNRMIDYVNDLNQKGYSLRINFREGTNEDVLTDVDIGRSALGILRTNDKNYDHYCYMAKKNQCKIYKVQTGPYSILMAQNHPLAQEKILTLDMLKPYTRVVHGDLKSPWYWVTK